MSFSTFNTLYPTFSRVGRERWYTPFPTHHSIFGTWRVKWRNSTSCFVLLLKRDNENNLSLEWETEL